MGVGATAHARLRICACQSVSIHRGRAAVSSFLRKAENNAGFADRICTGETILGPVSRILRCLERDLPISRLSASHRTKYVILRRFLKKGNPTGVEVVSLWDKSRDSCRINTYASTSPNFCIGCHSYEGLVWELASNTMVKTPTLSPKLWLLQWELVQHVPKSMFRGSFPAPTPEPQEQGAFCSFAALSPRSQPKSTDFKNNPPITYSYSHT